MIILKIFLFYIAAMAIVIPVHAAFCEIGADKPSKDLPVKALRICFYCGVALLALAIYIAMRY